MDVESIAAYTRRQTGTVRRWLKDKSFGFIAVDGEADADVFCHCSKVIGGVVLEEGATVSFELEVSVKGKRTRRAAIHVMPTMS